MNKIVSDKVRAWLLLSFLITMTAAWIAFLVSLGCDIVLRQDVPILAIVSTVAIVAFAAMMVICIRYQWEVEDEMEYTLTTGDSDYPGRIVVDSQGRILNNG